MRPMTSVALFLISLIYAYPVAAQPTLYSKVLYNDSASVTAGAACLAADGNYVIAGEYGNGAFLCKTDTLGNEIWSTGLGLQNNNRFRSIALTHDSGYVAAGGGSYGGVSPYCLVVKFDQWGDTVWTALIDLQGEAWSVRETFDHGVIVCGEPAYVAKLDSTGALEWSRAYESGNNDNWVFCCRQTPDSGYVVTGYAENYPPYDGYAFLYKLSATGNVQWAKKYNTNPPGSCFGKALEVVSDGFLCLFTVSNTTLIVKTDFSGNLQWVRNTDILNTGGCINCGIAGIHKTADAGFLIYAGDEFGFWGGPSLAKYDSSGNSLWAITPQLLFRDVINSPDSTYVLIGSGPIQGIRMSAPFHPHIGIIKTDSLCLNNNCAFPTSINSDPDSMTEAGISVIEYPLGSLLHPLLDVADHVLNSDPGCVLILPGIEAPENEIAFRVFPNPAAERVNFTWGDHAGKYRLSVYTILGQPVFMHEVNEDERDFTWDTRLASGMYSVVLESNDFVFTKKLVIR